jgi:hypothetical protein
MIIDCLNVTNFRLYRIDSIDIISCVIGFSVPIPATMIEGLSSCGFKLNVV